MQKSTPGIFIKNLFNKDSILENIIDLYNNKIIVINKFKKENIINLIELENLWEYSYVFPFPENSQSRIDFLKKINENYRLKYANLSKIEGIENKILYINFLIDQKKKIKN